jgi:hypothetical protein
MSLTHDQTMKSISKLSLCLTAYFFLFGPLFGEDAKNLIDLDRVADLLKFPRSELVVTDYTAQEKFIYTKKTSTEDQRGRLPPVDPASIYQAYWISSKTPNAFLPIIVTLSKPDAYLTPEVKKIIEDYNAYAETQRAQGGHSPFGDFELPGTSHASIYWKEIRVPAHSRQIIEPGDTWTRLDEYPKQHPAIVSIIRDASSEVDVRIAQYAELYYPDKLIKVPGGEEYFAAFNDDPEDNPKETPILNIFKGLNQIVLTSPIMNPYRKTPVPPVRTPEPPKAEAGKPAENPPAPQETPAPPLKPTNEVGSPSTPKILALVVLALGALAAIVFKIRRNRV